MADLPTELEKIVERHRLGTGCMSDEGNDLSVRALRAAVREAADAALAEAERIAQAESDAHIDWAESCDCAEKIAALRREKSPAKVEKTGGERG